MLPQKDIVSYGLWLRKNWQTCPLWAEGQAPSRSTFDRWVREGIIVIVHIGTMAYIDIERTRNKVSYLNKI